MSEEEKGNEEGKRRERFFLPYPRGKSKGQMKGNKRKGRQDTTGRRNIEETGQKKVSQKSQQTLGGNNF
jgi:hypothetical protein